MKQHRSAFDFDEIGPNRFVVNNPQLHSLIKGEGNLAGRMFDLTTWRRDGLLARLRERKFTVRTLADQIEMLPAPPDDLPPLGAPGWRALTTAVERYSMFDLDALGWRALEPEQRGELPGVGVYGGALLRRRKGRAAPTFHRAFNERGGSIGIQPIGEGRAILEGYAQALRHDDRALLAARRAEGALLPNVELPPLYRALLGRIAAPTDAGLLADERGWPLAQEVFARLGVRLKLDA